MASVSARSGMPILQADPIPPFSGDGSAPTGIAAQWNEANKRRLAETLDDLRAWLEQQVSFLESGQPASKPEPLPVPDAPMLDLAARLFGLSAFERTLLLLCAGVELDARFAALCGELQRMPGPGPCTFSLALAVLPESDWASLSPAAPLRWWKLITLGEAGSLALSPLRIDERILHFLLGVDFVDSRLAAILDDGPPVPELPESAYGAAEALGRHLDDDAGPVLHLAAGRRSPWRAVAHAACRAAGCELETLPVHAIPTAREASNEVLRLWNREARLSGRVLLVDCEEASAQDPAQARALEGLLRNVDGRIILVSADPPRLSGRALMTIALADPTPAEQRDVWHRELGPAPDDSADAPAARLSEAAVRQLAWQFKLDDLDIASIGEATRDLPPAALGAAAWNAARIRCRAGLDDLAQRLESRHGWDDLILPDAEIALLREIVVRVRQGGQVYQDWGFGAHGRRGTGVIALFAGASGTGKTLAAEIIARALDLDCYRVDLSAVSSKWIGETEKNLRRIFDAADESGAVLLFDEADAIFGKRTEVKDSHDRHANLEVSYLLQRVEAYRGLAILTTNMKAAIDHAFLRRLSFVVSFPLPDAAQRERVWRRVFPAQVPLAPLDFGRLATLNVSGAQIRNIALAAAFRAAEESAPIGMRHLREAARLEYFKLERTFPESETREWV